MEILLILVPFIASVLTFFCGFGLGTLLLPVFLLFYPPGMAIALTALVHLLNSLFKFILIRRQADYSVVWAFGIPSVIGALIGSVLSVYVARSGTMYVHHLFDKETSVSWISFMIGLILIVFVVIEIKKIKLQFSSDKNMLFSGGILSGFFGGLSGHQGALRTAFLNHMLPDKTVLIASNTVIAMMVDLTRLPVYWNKWINQYHDLPIIWLVISVTSAWAGALIGNRYLKKAHLNTLEIFIAIVLCVFGLGLMLGII